VLERRAMQQSSSFIIAAQVVAMTGKYIGT
jgi:hypothetical protein